MAEITNTLLKQAIADAEAVRETAVANAKLVLEEAITPQIRDMIARRLRVEAMEGEEEKEEKKEPMKTEAEGHDKAKEEPLQNAEPVGSSEMPADSSTIGTGDNKEPSADAFDSADDDMSGEAPADSATDWYDDWSESDFDLAEVIKELEEDIAALSGDTEEDSEEMEEVAMGSDVNKYTKPEMANEADKTEDMPKANPADVHDKEVPATSSKIGEGEHGAEKKEMPAAPTADAGEKKDDEELDLEEILAELEADEDEMGAAHDDKEKMAAELAGLKREMAQYKEAVGILRSRLQEVNLLNAKLLFTNKMFKKESLTNEQKVRIVESFDRATTVREVKLVYTALVENLSTAAKTFNASRKKVVTEGFASKATPSTAPKAEVIVENTVAKRLQELAGII